MYKIKTTTQSFCLCILIVLLTASNAKSQDLSKHQALYISRFINYVEWATFTNEEVIIGVVGNSRVLIELQNSVKAKGLKAVIRKVNGIYGALECNVLFIPTNQEKLFHSINKSSEGKPILIITENETLAKQGSVITFYTESNKLKFIINKEAAKSRGLKISASLLSLAKII